MTKSLKEMNSAQAQNLEKQELVHPDELIDLKNHYTNEEIQEIYTMMKD